MDRFLADSSYLYALHDAQDKYHLRAITFNRLGGIQMLVADVVLGEVMFLTKRIGGIPALLKFLDNFLSSDAVLIPITRDDLRRVREIEATYASAELDFVDCCIMALSRTAEHYAGLHL